MDFLIGKGGIVMVMGFRFISGLCFGTILTVFPSSVYAAENILNERQLSLAMAGEAAEAAVMQTAEHFLHTRQQPSASETYQ